MFIILGLSLIVNCLMISSINGNSHHQLPNGRLVPMTGTSARFMSGGDGSGGGGGGGGGSDSFDQLIKKMQGVQQRMKSFTDFLTQMNNVRKLMIDMSNAGGGFRGVMNGSGMFGGGSSSGSDSDSGSESSSASNPSVSGDGSSDALRVKSDRMRMTSVQVNPYANRGFVSITTG